MTTDTMTTERGSADRVRQATARTLARRRGFKLMSRKGAYWIVRNDELIAGGARGLTLDELESEVRELTRTMPRIAD